MEINSCEHRVRSRFASRLLFRVFASSSFSSGLWGASSIASSSSESESDDVEARYSLNSISRISLAENFRLVTLQHLLLGFKCRSDEKVTKHDVAKQQLRTGHKEKHVFFHRKNECMDTSRLQQPVPIHVNVPRLDVDLLHPRRAVALCVEGFWYAKWALCNGGVSMLLCH